MNTSENKQSIRHLAIIMDGNGRWAKKQGKSRTAGHFAGTNNVRDIAIEANNRGIEVLTVFAFSTENWSRPKEEVNYLMGLPKIFFDSFLKELMEKNIRVQMIGHMDGIPKSTAKLFKDAIDKTSKNTGMILCFAMNYGSQDEIVYATKEIAQMYHDGKIELEDIDTKTFKKYLMTKDYPDVDLMIRTSGEYRISNFLLYQLAYSELMFVDVPWPEFTPEILDKCIDDFKMRDRRFGGVKK